MDQTTQLLSQRLQKKALAPQYKKQWVDLEQAMARPSGLGEFFQHRPAEISAAGSLPQIIFRGEVAPSGKIKSLSYASSFDLELFEQGLVEALVELAHNLDFHKLSKIQLREVESFLRDENHRRAFPDDDSSTYNLQALKTMELVSNLMEGLLWSGYSYFMESNGEAATHKIKKISLNELNLVGKVRAIEAFFDSGPRWVLKNLGFKLVFVALEQQAQAVVVELSDENGPDQIDRHVQQVCLDFIGKCLRQELDTGLNIVAE